VYAVEVVDLVKEFRKGKPVLKKVSFKIRENEVFGLVGPNGSGKTTTLRIISTLLKPTRGKVLVYGRDVTMEPDKVRSMIAYLPEDAGVYERLTGWENLFYYAAIYTKDWEKAREIASYGAELSGLGGELHRMAGEYSKGMKRRLTLARTLMVKPKLALLDEATTGLDVFSAVQIRRILKDYTRKYSSSIVFSSHNMLEIELLCDRVAFILNGKLVIIGKPYEIKEKYKASNLEEAFVKAVETEGKTI
jgi:ABC-2 type transport system ATP-binding protein